MVIVIYIKTEESNQMWCSQHALSHAHALGIVSTEILTVNLHILK